MIKIQIKIRWMTRQERFIWWHCIKAKLKEWGSAASNSIHR